MITYPLHSVPMQSYHLTYASDGRLALLPDEALRRQALHALARTVGDRVVLFCLVDDHIHVVLLCEAERVGLLSRALLLALRPLTGPGLAPAFVRPVEGRGHLEWLFRYVLEQPSKHGLPGHPALWPGSCFPDLVGARRLPGLSLRHRLSEVLPRLRLRSAYGHVGLAPERLQPLDPDTLRGLGIRRLVDAASAALAADPALAGNSELVVGARVTVAHLAAAWPTSELAWALDITPQAARRLRTRAAPEGAVEAVRLRLALEERVRAAAG